MFPNSHPKQPSVVFDNVFRRLYKRTHWELHFLYEIICLKKELLSGLAISFIMKEIFDKFIKYKYSSLLNMSPAESLSYDETI